MIRSVVFFVVLTAASAQDAPPGGWNFRNHVMPVLTKAGCNQGACHGALAGKGGFKLSLRGYDPELDYDVLTRQSVGRRINLAEPGNSLMLRKPTMQTPHGGGLRFKPNSPNATTIVLSSSPRCFKSSSRELYAMSNIGPTRSR